jgi:hypothetical protein
MAPAKASQTFSSSWATTSAFWNLSRYSRGMMGYQTPNIDRLLNDLKSELYVSFCYPI